MKTLSKLFLMASLTVSGAALAHEGDARYDRPVDTVVAQPVPQPVQPYRDDRYDRYDRDRDGRDDRGWRHRRHWRRVALYPTQPPPFLAPERVAPRRGFVWVPASYAWQNGAYVYVTGHWERRPHGMRYLPGRWERSGDRYVWIEATWVPFTRWYR